MDKCTGSLTKNNEARKRVRHSVLAASLAAVLCLFAVALPAATTISAATHPATHFRSAESTVNAYFRALNSGMTSGDFSDLGAVYATQATLTKSSPDGTTTVFRGIEAITAFYHTLYVKIPNWQWTTDELRPLSKGIVLAYEHAGSPPLTVASRCVHVFVIKNGKIVRYDWAAFFPGQK